jgi:hypothetical protein
MVWRCGSRSRARSLEFKPHPLPLPEKGDIQAWWCIPLIPVLKRLRQEDFKLKDIPNCTASYKPVWATE